MARSLLNFDALSFDCYGTLIDWESGIWDALQPLLAADGAGAVTRSEALKAFAEAESAREKLAPGAVYPDILTATHRALAERFGLETNAELDAAFGQSVPLWPAFPDTAEALRFLKTRYRLVILSNVHLEGFAASNRKLGVAFDAVYTAQDIGSYKPDEANFAYMLEHLEHELGVERDRILHTAQSLFHDHVPARKLGLANAWIDRQRLSEGGDWGATAELNAVPETDFVFFTLGEMAQAVRREGHS